MYIIRKYSDCWAVHNDDTGASRRLSEAEKELVLIEFPALATTPSGRFQQNIQFIFSEYDNQLRREKCMAGVKEKLLAGIWCTSVPLGYDIVRSEGQPKLIVLNAKGKLIKYAFELKAMGMSNEDIRKQLAAKGPFPI